VTSRPALPYLWMLCGSLSFAFMAVCASLLRDHCDWRVTALARSGLATVFAVLLCWRAGARLVVFRPRILWVRSVAGSISLLCTFYSFTRLPVSDLLTLTNTFPIWVAVLSWPLLQEAPDRSVWVSVASGVVGVALIQQPHFREGNFATLLALVASVSSAVAMLGLHRLHDLDPRAVVAHFSGVSSLFVVLALFLLPGAPLPAGAPAPAAWALLLGVGVTATVGQLFLTRAFAAGPPSRVSVVGLSQIVFVLVLEGLIQPRAYGLETLAGMALILAPTAYVLWRGKGAEGCTTTADAETREQGQPVVHVSRVAVPRNVNGAPSHSLLSPPRGAGSRTSAAPRRGPA
jgi:drug/metabolite transporter (DMT)-like permease